MADEPQEPQEPTEPQEPQEPTEPIEPTEPTEPIEPAEPTTQEIVDAALEKQEDRWQSWTGRRELAFKTMLDEKVAAPAEPAASASEQAYDDPVKWFNTEFDKSTSARENAHQTHMGKVMQSAAHLMNDNPLYAQTKPGENKLGAEVLKNVVQMISVTKPQPGMTPEAMAETLVNRSLNIAMQNKGKANPLAKNTVTGEPLGTVTTPKTPDPPKKKMPELNDLVKNYIKQTGMSEEKAAELLAD